MGVLLSDDTEYCRTGGNSSYVLFVNFLTIQPHFAKVLKKLCGALELILLFTLSWPVSFFSHKQLITEALVFVPVLTFILCKNSKCISPLQLSLPPSWRWPLLAVCLDRRRSMVATLLEEHAPSRPILFLPASLVRPCRTPIGTTQPIVEHVCQSLGLQETASLQW